MSEVITLSHGSGGEKSEALMRNIILPYLGNDKLNNLSDGAYLNLNGKLAFSTDSFVINPIFFPGGNIGKLAVCGTCNDLLMCGSKPKYLSLSFIIEEGLEIATFRKIVKSISDISKIANVSVVTGDTKVVDKGLADKIYINTSGIGLVDESLSLDRNRITKGDKVIVTGNIGDHGISILCEREKFFETSIMSDCNYVEPLTSIIFKYGKKVKVLRDPTRGGVATTLNEFVDGSSYSIEINESNLPYSNEGRAVSEILGIDLLYSANEGNVVLVVSEDIANELVEKLRKETLGKNASIIGEVVDYDKGKVLLKGKLGSRKVIGRLTSNLFPRIC